MTEKILFVDDEANLLAAIKRQLYKEFKVDTALGSEEGLAALRNNGPYAVVVSDLRMPGMDGIQFLAAVHDRSPDTVRVMLSGNADFEASIASVNEGNIFRFLLKPIQTEILIKVLNAALQQYQLVVSQRELLQNTLQESIKVMTDMLSIVSPIAYVRALRVTNYVRQIVGHLMIPNAWQFELAALVSQLGCIALPQSVLEKMERGQELTDNERKMIQAHPEIAYDLLVGIPRLESIATMVLRQPLPFHLTDLDSSSGRTMDLGSQVIGAALDYDAMLSSGIDPFIALQRLRNEPCNYHPSIVSALEMSDYLPKRMEESHLQISELKPGMIMGETVRTNEGQLLASEGQEITIPVKNHLRFWLEQQAIHEPLRVLIPQNISMQLND